MGKAIYLALPLSTGRVLASAATLLEYGWPPSTIPGCIVAAKRAGLFNREELDKSWSGRVSKTDRRTQPTRHSGGTAAMPLVTARTAARDGFGADKNDLALWDVPLTFVWRIVSTDFQPLESSYVEALPSIISTCRHDGCRVGYNNITSGKHQHVPAGNRRCHL